MSEASVIPSPSTPERLALVFDWYRGMVSPRTGRLVYTYNPETNVTVDDGSAVRDLASIWDMEILGRYLGRDELRPIIERSLRHWSRGLVAGDGGGLLLDRAALGEPPGIAHDAFLLLALLDADFPVPDRDADARALADAIVHQQRPDGSYRVYFGGEPDDGYEFYPGEAMVGLMRAYAAFGDRRYLESVERGFYHACAHRPAHAVDPELLVFYANWQAQYAVTLHEHAASADLRRAVRDHVFALHDRLVASGFYDEVERYPERQATVEVACALEGLADAYRIATREQDRARIAAYEPCVRVAVAWLHRAQRLEGAPRERGGFGHSLRERVQRVDVTGHALNGLIKASHDGLA